MRPQISDNNAFKEMGVSDKNCILIIIKYLNPCLVFEKNVLFGEVAVPKHSNS